MRVLIFPLLIIGAFVCQGLLLATDYHVDCNNGSDENSGLSWEQAWETMEHAAGTAQGNEADPGVIHIAEGSYGDPYWSPPYYYYETLQLPRWVWLKGRGLVRPDLKYNICFLLGCQTVFENITAINIGGIGASQDAYIELRNCRLEFFSPYALAADHTMDHFSLTVNISECLIGYANCGGLDFGGEQASYDLFLDSTVLVGIASYGGSPPSVLGRSIWLGFGDVNRTSAIPRMDRLVVENCAFLGTSYCAEQIYVELGAGENWLCDAVFSNCLFAFTEYDLGPGGGGFVPERCLWMETTGNGRCDVRFRSSTVVGDVAIVSEGLGGNSQHVSIMDSVFWTDQDNLVFGQLPELEAKFSCTSWPVDGEGVIHEHPLFATGALGEHHLSHADADQPMTSPCVDGGSMLASESTVAGLTTRTDHTPDTAMVDMGFHYGRKIGPDPRVEFAPFIRFVSPGVDLALEVTLSSHGVMMLAEVYLAAAYGDQLFYLSDDGWTQNQSPWMRRAPIVGQFGGDYTVSLHVPENIPTGTYTIYMALIDHYAGDLVSLASTQVEVLPA